MVLDRVPEPKVPSRTLQAITNPFQNLFLLLERDLVFIKLHFLFFDLGATVLDDIESVLSGSTILCMGLVGDK
jgi:hypothetical protein